MQLSYTKAVQRNFFKTIFGNSGNDKYERPQLNFKEFLIIATVYNMNVNYLTAFLELVIYNGAIWVCVLYFILTAVLGMPLSMLFIFLSSYSKKSYLAIWDCAPLLEGCVQSSLVVIRRRVIWQYGTALLCLKV
ncbi:hypothetical protein QE152_g21942 [Popillia japonica]|uniref:Uncharacterized protein n=1 Tax=Popillia japonica TaxID=7064 RepID=A0AAW1KLT1_POPJA